MHIIGVILSGFFIAFIIGVALTFGLALMGALLLVGLGAASLFYGQQLWLRWRFKDNAEKAESSNVRIIEAEYTEIKRDE